MTGESTSYPNQKYCINDVFRSLLKFEDKKFWYFFKICIQVIYSRDFYRYIDFNYNCNELINDLNAIMERNSVDLKIEYGNFINISDLVIQEEVMTLMFIELKKEGFTNAVYDFNNSIKFLKEGDNRNAIHSAGSALESTVGYIMEKKNLTLKKEDKMPNKLKCIIESGVLPKEYESNFDALIKVLLTSPVIRNKNGAHGSTGEYSVDSTYAKYAIDSAASSILFLVRLYRLSFDNG